RPCRNLAAKLRSFAQFDSALEYRFLPGLCGWTGELGGRLHEQSLRSRGQRFSDVESSGIWNERQLSADGEVAVRRGYNSQKWKPGDIRHSRRQRPRRFIGSTGIVLRAI